MMSWAQFANFSFGLAKQRHSLWRLTKTSEWFHIDTRFSSNSDNEELLQFLRLELSGIFVRLLSIPTNRRMRGYYTGYVGCISLVEWRPIRRHRYQPQRGIHCPSAGTLAVKRQKCSKTFFLIYYEKSVSVLIPSSRKDYNRDHLPISEWNLCDSKYMYNRLLFLNEFQ